MRWRGMLAAVAAVVVVVAGVAPAQPAGAVQAQSVRSLRFLGTQTLPHRMDYGQTVVGGLSGVDYDPVSRQWYLISDDRARYNDPRFYTATMDFDAFGGFRAVALTGVWTLLSADGRPVPGYGLPGTVDPEAIRFDPWTRRLAWASEGDRPGPAGLPVADPFIRWADPDGEYLGQLPLPGNLSMTDRDSGPRRNFGFEGVAITARRVTAVVEGPRYEDGPPPTVSRGAPARITVWDRTGRVLAQYAYQIDALPAAPVPADGATDSGVSEILAIDDNRFLALERSWLEGVGYKVKLYEFDLRRATNVAHRDSLLTAAPYQPVAKRLIADLGAFASPVQNLEGMAWGPRLSTGECTLVLASDDNFAAEEVTEFLAFAIHSAADCPHM